MIRETTAFPIIQCQNVMKSLDYYYVTGSTLKDKAARMSF